MPPQWEQQSVSTHPNRPPDSPRIGTRLARTANTVISFGPQPVDGAQFRACSVLPARYQSPEKLIRNKPNHYRVKRASS
jgi:hypothetical protein